MTWGLLGPEKIEGTRRARTLGVAAAVREFNDLAVPGLGGVWFGKQLILATLGVLLAEQAVGKRISNITMANAVEALACGLTLRKVKDGGQLQDARLRGSTKLRGKADFSFNTVRRTGFYVTQPMRMATVQALPALGLVASEASRFNAFVCTEQGEALIDAALGKKLVNTLNQWVSGTDRDHGNDLRKALSPLASMPDAAKKLILAQVRQGSPHEEASSKARRRTALDWVEFLRVGDTSYPDWEVKPPELDPVHWNDLQAGALFFSTRAAAISLLDVLEAHIAIQTVRTLCLVEPVPPHIANQIDQLRERAKAYLALGHTQDEAKVFCGECLDGDNTRVLSKLVGRDGRVLQVRMGCVVPGPAFKAQSELVSTTDADIQPDTNAPGDASDQTRRWPEGISVRMNNLFMLNADLQGDMSRWMKNPPAAEAEQT